MSQYIRRVAGNRVALWSAGLAIFGSAFAVAAVTHAQIECRACTFDSTQPSDAVKIAIESSQPASGLVDSVGDIYVVCNATECGRYVVSSDFRYNLVEKVSRPRLGGGGGGSGGPDGGGGSGGGGGGVPNPGGGGCAPKCTGGTVIVRDPGGG